MVAPSEIHREMDRTVETLRPAKQIGIRVLAALLVAGGVLAVVSIRVVKKLSRPAVPSKTRKPERRGTKQMVQQKYPSPLLSCKTN